MGAGAEVRRLEETPTERRLRIARKELADARFSFQRAAKQLADAETNYRAKLASVNRRRAALEEVERETGAN